MAKGGFRGGSYGGMNQMQMMKQAQKMQQDLLKMQEELEKAQYTATAGGGVVTATVSGKHELVALEIDPDAVDPEDAVVSRDDFRASMDRFLGELTSYEHKVFDLYIRGHSYDVIAKALDVSKKSVDNAIYRIRAKLKQQFHM